MIEIGNYFGHFRFLDDSIDIRVHTWVAISTSENTPQNLLHLTPGPLDKVAAISQTTFSNKFSLLKSFYFVLNFVCF